ncbi:hypothetical protein GCM10010168_51060 [Actinoplanes ianthinogenes]|uniref:Uncharacterized protein n=1 Tax=Actinoplanes ianthinogenes TaxID=122358 RepID=A0ABN6CPT6_9ACTN|nr:hypothetical protein [Actinoplanes ianthinogenes]BCJ46157.1 hypothetical protein Aiant_68140 [Actinoplanes ianthinogenes]GGR26666.1 hypothetical protein GCM10010168_51060 [Actinoplanes ianthinogenes]
MESNSVVIRRTALLAPALLLTYGILRFLDGLDGDRGNGPLWTVGHLAFFAGMVLFGVLTVAVRNTFPADRRRVATVATGASLAGVAAFLWVIAGDLSDAFREAAPLPGLLEKAGPMLFPVGVLVLFGMMVAARRLPVWTPLVFGLGIVAISVNLNLLPFAALAILGALAPLRRVATARHLRPGRANLVH